MKKIACEMCGSSDIVRKGHLVVCNTCGAKFTDIGFEFEAIKTAENPNLQASFLLNFKLSDTAARKAFGVWLVSGDFTPRDISSKAVIKKTLKVFAPAWYLTGNYSGDWSASSGYDRRETYTYYKKERVYGKNGRWYTKTVPETRSRIVTDWRPSNGKIGGAFASLKFANKSIDAELGRVVADKVQWCGGELVRFEDFDMTDYELLPYELTAADAFSKYKPELEKKVRDDITVPGDRYRDLRYTYSQNYSSMKIFYPIYLYEYTYDNDVYYAIIDGRDEGNIFGTRPKDNGLIIKTKLFFLPLVLVSASAVIVTLLKARDAVLYHEIKMFLYTSGFSVLYTVIAYGFGVSSVRFRSDCAKKRKSALLDENVNIYNDLDSDTAKIKAKIFRSAKRFFVTALVCLGLIMAGYGIYYGYTKITNKNDVYIEDAYAFAYTPIEFVMGDTWEENVLIKSLSFSPETGKISIQVNNLTDGERSFNVDFICCSAEDESLDTISLSNCKLSPHETKTFETVPKKNLIFVKNAVPKDTVKIIVAGFISFGSSY